MPIFIAALWGGLLSVAASLAGRILIALCIGYVTYTGVSILLDSIKDHIFSNFGGLDSQILAILALLKVGQAINIQISAVAARLVLSGLTSGAVTKMVIK